MNITITGRHINLSEDQKQYATKKIKKLEKYFNQMIDARMVMHVEKLDHWSEVTINGDGIQFHGREKAADFLSSIDLLSEKMEKQIIRYKERHQMHKGPEKGFTAIFPYTSDKGIEYHLNQVSNKPIDKVEAYLQMKLSKSNFILFKKGVAEVESESDFGNKNYAVIYKSDDKLTMIEIPFDKIKDHQLNTESLVAYDIHVVADSMTNPDIQFKKRTKAQLKGLSLEEALNEIIKNNEQYLPFFNVESQYLNIIFKNGSSYEILVPAF